MSQRPLSNKIERTCEGCGLKKEFELLNIDEATVIEMTGWYNIIREVVDPEHGGFVKLFVQACSLACVPAAAVKLALPPQNQQELESKIDLNSLRAPILDPSAN